MYFEYELQVAGWHFTYNMYHIIIIIIFTKSKDTPWLSDIMLK